ncbi:MAG: cytochrome c3 family protein [Candidatus Krumholzibacteriia bacterium]
MKACYRNPHLLVTVVAAAALVAVAAVAAPTGHDGISCRLCHADAGAVAAGGGMPAAQQQCLACHPGARQAGPAPSFHGRGRCLDCHGFHAPGTVTTAAGTLALEDLAGVARDHCLACHDGKGRLADLSDAHRAAGRLYHEHAASLRERSPSTPCLWCHSDSRSTDWQAVPAADRLAFAEHASHPIGIPVRPGQGPVVRRMREVIDPRIPLPGGRLECVSCHQLTAATEDRLIPFPTAQELCVGCHQLNEPADRRPLAAAGLAGR